MSICCWSFVDMVSGAEGIAAMKGTNPCPPLPPPPDITVEHQPSRLTSTLPRATASVGVLAAVATTTGATVLRAAGVPLAVHGKIPLAGFAQITFIGAVIGGVLLALLIRRSPAPRQQFVRITIGLTALSCVAPVAFADTTASKVSLVALHLVAATIIVTVLAQHAD